MLNSIKTEDQRMTVEIGMDCIMPGIEIANNILYDAWEEFFGNVPQQSISALEAEHLGCNFGIKGPNESWAQRIGPGNCLTKTQGCAKLKDNVYSLTPARCWKE